MKKEWFTSYTAGFLFVSLLGSLMHFVYEWTNQCRLAGLFASINESTWEHMKLLFFPMLLYLFLESLLFSSPDSKKAASGISLLFGTYLIPVLFYTYRGVLGFSIPVLDISTFFLSTAAAFLLYRRLSICSFSRLCGRAVSLLVFLQMAAFFWFTYLPPNLGIFVSPV